MLQISAVEKQFGQLEVLKEIDLHVEKGEFLVLLGPSGCGKSTLLNIIAGLMEPSSGDILIDANSVTDLDPKDRDIAMVFQSYALYPSMTVFENLSFGMRVRGVPRAQRDTKVASVASILKLDDLLDRKPGQLSGGQRQRVAMGRALVREPKVFLFDEPLSNLDEQLRVEMRTELKKLHSRLNATIVYVTHDQVEAMTLATKVVVMHGGVAQQIGMPQEIYDRPKNTFVAKFIGSPSMNLFQADCHFDDGALWLTVQNGATKSRLSMGPVQKANTDLNGKKVICGIRPEAIAKVSEGTERLDNTFNVEVAFIEPTGSDDLVVFQLGDSDVLARFDPNLCKSGERISVRLPPEKLLVYDVDSGELLF